MKRVIFFALSLLVIYFMKTAFMFYGSAGVSETPQPALADTKDKLQEAFELAKNGRFEAAEAGYMKCLNGEKNPKNIAIVHEMLGDLYMNMRKFDKAAQHYGDLIAIAPDLKIAYYKKGNALQHIPNKQKDAIIAFEKSIKLGFNDAEVYINMGFCYKILLDFYSAPDSSDAVEYMKKAVENYNIALNMRPGDMAALGNLADIYYNFKNYEEALKLYIKLDGISPKSPIILAKLGHTYLSMGKIEKAVEILENAVLQYKNVPKPADSVGAAIRDESEALVYVYLIEAMKKLEKKTELVKYGKKLLELTDAGSKQRSLKMEKLHQMAETLLKENAR